MRSADAHQVPAGGALAVDRDEFSAAVTQAIESHPLIRIDRGEVDGLPPADWDNVIVATGPLTSPALAEAIRNRERRGRAGLLRRDCADRASRIRSTCRWPGFSRATTRRAPAASGADYINCPLDRAQYDAFVDALVDADTVSFHEWEATTPYFDGCLPVEVMAKRGRETLRHGPMKPFGLTNPHKPHEKAYAVVQLRQDNKLGTLFNMVGFQTKLKHGEQSRLLRMIPGLEQAEFARLGGLHRNTYLNSPKVLDESLRLQGDCPGCVLPGRFPAARVMSNPPPSGFWPAALPPPSGLRCRSDPPPPTTAHGALLGHITGGHIETIDAGPRSFQPMNVNFGLFPPLAQMPTRDENGQRLRGPAKTIAKKRALTARALDLDLDAWTTAANV